MSPQHLEQWFTFSTFIIALIGILSLTGCQETSSRYDWSPENKCLADHYEEMCYEDAETMAAFTHHNTTHAKRLIERAQRLHKIEKTEEEAKSKAKDQYDGLSDRKVSIEDIEVEEIPGRDTMSQEEINRHRNLDKLKKYFSDSNRTAPESVW